ncbi:hypothetical protein [Halalkalibacter akibai]|uniref:Uncharacterized protein n=1 Tax=Halalkalibacter akibai (strain ATCC 43226 / DSM 21942 / CIP 109018 / JCM 9157 / 1139) TaxID=1236973 RepID=W4QQ64_HALA3|nr:hypothetical protein [Halalkalibacter akibai]GAE33464.1 hypothetical protein JCM9157_467 [Halalkalibacter akibai JCM 9157]
MWIVVILLLFVFTIGLTIGGLLTAPREPVKPIHLILFTLFFLFLCYLGMITGMFLSGWIAIRFIEIVLAILSLLFIVACFSRFHPTLGFFHPEDKILISVLAFLFFLMGVEWGVLEFRTFFTLACGILFAFALAAGVFIQLQIKQALWRNYYCAFAPLVWLLFVSILKLL